VRWLLEVPIAWISIANWLLMVTGLTIDATVFGSEGPYPFPMLVIGAALLSYAPYYCVSRGETIFRNDPGGAKSRTLFYGVAYFFLLLVFVTDLDLLRRWLASGSS
jgi:hypothetical protein